MKKISILLLFFVQVSIGQISPDFSAIDNQMALIPSESTKTTSGIAEYINSNFKTENEKIRAIYYWITTNISYDVPNMYAPNNLDSPEVKIANTLRTRKGVCIHYSEVFSDIANKLGMKTYIIAGYTKVFDEIPTLAHAWNVSKIDGKWFLFDATWGAGFIDGKNFTKKQNNTYFKREPDRMIVNHMPFDYMWQLLNEPMSNQEFISGKIDNSKPKINYNFQAEIEKYEKLPDTEKAFECAARIEKNGLLNSMITDYYNLKKKEFTVLNQNKSVEKLITITANFNEGIRSLNNFIAYRNKRFKPEKSDEALKKMIQEPKDLFNKSIEDINTVGDVSPENMPNFNALKKSIAAALEKTKEHEKFLNDYLSKGLAGRKLMFLK